MKPVKEHDILTIFDALTRIFQYGREHHYYNEFLSDIALLSDALMDLAENRVFQAKLKKDMIDITQLQYRALGELQALDIAIDTLLKKNDPKVN
jgi:hypothetical protein